MKKFLLCSLILFAACSPAPAQISNDWWIGPVIAVPAPPLASVQSPTAADPWENYRAVVQLNLAGRSQRSSIQGSGTLVAVDDKGNGLILSCRHVCEREGKLVNVQWYGVAAKRGLGDLRTSGVVLYVHSGRGFQTDLALVFAKVPRGAKPVKVGKFSPDDGPFYSVGYRDKRFLESVSPGAYLNGNLVTMTSPFLGGMSGGATFNKRGEVIAVVVASDRNTTGISTNGESLHNMLDLFRQTEGVLR